MLDWKTFFAAIGGISATLAGLLFVAMQINLDLLVSDPGNRWRATARSTFSVYTLLITMSLFYLLPALDQRGRAAILLVLTLFGIFRAARTWWPVWKNRLQKPQERLVETFWMLVGPVLTYGILGYNALDLYNTSNPDSTTFGIAITFIALLVVALRNSWNLVFEVTYERKQQATQAKKD
jgi:hypothetical protein